MEQPVSVLKLCPTARLPRYGTAFSAGADLFACLPEPLCIAPGQTVLVPTGLAMELPAGCVGLIYARSSLAAKKGLAPANKVGVIDSDYRGEILVCMFNQSAVPQTIADGERIAQMVLTPYYTASFSEAQSLSDTVRGTGGFGSTGSR